MNPIERFHDLVGRRGWLLADGATGTNLFALGLTAGDAPELCNVDNPDPVRQVYRDAMQAGAELVLTNSFGATRSRLQLHHAADRAHELARQSAILANEVADELSSNTIVVGSMGPTGELMAPVGNLDRLTAIEIFQEQAEGLKAGGAAMAWIETMSDIEELDCAAEACTRAGLQFCTTMSFDTHGRTMMGASTADLSGWAAGSSQKPLGYGANCGAGAADLVRTLLEFRQTSFGLPIIAKGNAGIPRFEGGQVHYDGSPELMADYAALALRAGASIIGGCCGTGPEHLKKMRERLEAAPAGAPPDPDEIVARLGRFSSIGPSKRPRSRTRKSRRQPR